MHPPANGGLNKKRKKGTAQNNQSSVLASIVTCCQSTNKQQCNDATNERNQPHNEPSTRSKAADGTSMKIQNIKSGGEKPPAINKKSY
jgi:hypothetical protein